MFAVNAKCVRVYMLKNMVSGIHGVYTGVYTGIYGYTRWYTRWYTRGIHGVYTVTTEYTRGIHGVYTDNRKLWVYTGYTRGYTRGVYGVYKELIFCFVAVSREPN